MWNWAFYVCFFLFMNFYNLSFAAMKWLKWSRDVNVKGKPQTKLWTFRKKIHSAIQEFPVWIRYTRKIRSILLLRNNCIHKIYAFELASLTPSEIKTNPEIFFSTVSIFGLLRNFWEKNDAEKTRNRHPTVPVAINVKPSKRNEWLFDTAYCVFHNIRIACAINYHTPHKQP